MTGWNESSMSQPIRSESNGLMSGRVSYLMLDITIPPYPVPVLLLANLVGYRGPTIVKYVLCLGPSIWVGALARLWTGMTLPGGGVLSAAPPL